MIVVTFLTAVLTFILEIKSRRMAFIEMQARDFYGPLVGLYQEIKAKDAIWNQILDLNDAARQSAQLEGRHEAAESLRFISLDFDNKERAEEIMPAFFEMLNIFRKNYHLADSTTEKFYETLATVIGIWRREQANAITPSMRQKLPNSNDHLLEFYRDIGGHLTRLRGLLANGKPDGCSWFMPKCMRAILKRG